MIDRIIPVNKKFFEIIIIYIILKVLINKKKLFILLTEFSKFINKLKLLDVISIKL